MQLPSCFLGLCQHTQSCSLLDLAVSDFVELVFTPLYKLVNLFCGATAQRAMASSFTRFPDHTQRRTTVGRTPLDERSARHRDLYLTTHNTQKKQTSMLRTRFEMQTSRPLGPAPSYHRSSIYCPLYFHWVKVCPLEVVKQCNISCKIFFMSLLGVARHFVCVHWYSKRQLKTLSMIHWK
jgi:hypothetical protein